MIRCPIPLALALATTLLLPTPAAHAQVQRCITPTGEAVYTDRECADIDAVPVTSEGRQARSSDGPRTACPRTVEELLPALGAAIDSHDPNRLAELYHWPGTGTRSGYAILDRLDAISQRTLVGIDLLDAPPSPGAATQPRRRPRAIRVEQVASDSAAPVRTVFSLHRHLGCWWLGLTPPQPPAAPAADDQDTVGTR